MKTKSTSGRAIAKDALLVVLSPMPKLGDGVRFLCNSKGLVRTFERFDEPRLQALGLPLIDDNGEVLDLLVAGRSVITTVRVMKAISHAKNKDFAEPVAYKTRAKPTRKTPSITQIMAKAG
jgi:hypothetical protein